jgi:hypothetical protein
MLLAEEERIKPDCPLGEKQGTGVDWNPTTPGGRVSFTYFSRIEVCQCPTR